LELHARTLLELPQSISQCQKLRLLDLRDTIVDVRPLQTFSMPNLAQVLVARRR